MTAVKSEKLPFLIEKSVFSMMFFLDYEQVINKSKASEKKSKASQKQVKSKSKASQKQVKSKSKAF